ncbi:MAG: tRNA (adenosine(37)-N6)-threonylcarbamoyltransferase complex dimerization subunit type 1 TsaB [Novosphingobium sp.]|nr:tRNA (adenosine(37)-N6)-threonylcarbamoyltransferase complex dimerization subunit type 1 TsaB [Novosphingobium sp.]
MLTLAIDCATEACSVALFDDDRLITGDFQLLGRGHAEQLVPMLAKLPGKGRAERIAVGLGPGSFTGVRVGLAAARALAFAWNAALVGYPTLELVAAHARMTHAQVPLAVAMTGGHGEWFVQRFAADGSEVAACASRPPEDAALVPEGLVVGSQAEALVVRRGFGEVLALWPDARNLPQLPLQALTSDPHPLYGRAPDARLPTPAC